MRALLLAVPSLAALAACAAYPPAPVAPIPSNPPAVASASAPTPTEPVPAPVPALAPATEPAPAAMTTPAPTPMPTPTEPTPTEPTLPPSACNDQSPQEFLVRGHFLKEPGGNERAIQYRTDQYGYFKGFGRPAPGTLPPTAHVESTTFMGLPVRMHRKVIPALACVEQEIRATCADHPYTAQALAGIRYRNTYRGGEVTNHAYGIAIDVDPSRNTCCGCVPPWNDAPACKRKSRSEYDHMAMPECWVHAFERFGFYWLGHDVLRDTMHFEFLGDPDHIVKSVAASAPAAELPASGVTPPGR